MNNQLIDLCNIEEDTLFVIGNGFDQAHGIKCTYQDFHNWLSIRGYQNVVTNLEQIFPSVVGNKKLLWQDFEKALGLYNEESIHNHFFQGDDTGSFDEDVQRRASDRIKYYIERIPFCMKEWAQYIDGSTYNRAFLGLSPNFKYLSFNYTSVLERLYSIPSINICHIHGSIKDKKVVVGHNQEKTPLLANNIKTNREGSISHIIELMNTNVKPVKTLINNNIGFFGSLSNITRVVVIGHSLAPVDMPYFQEIAMRIKPKSRWYIYSHTFDDDARIRKQINSYPFTNFLCTIHHI